MDSIFIKQLVNQQLAKKGITDGSVYILEKKWGLVSNFKLKLKRQ